MSHAFISKRDKEMRPLHQSLSSALSFLLIVATISLDCVAGQAHKQSGKTESSKASHSSDQEIEAVAKALKYNFLRLSYPSQKYTDGSSKTNQSRPPQLDIIFALDASSSANVFDYERKLTEKLLDAFSLAPSTARAAVASCARSWAHFNFDFKTHVNKEAVIEFLPTLRYLENDRGLGPCLRSIYYQAFVKHPTMRKGARKVMFVITTDKSPVLQHVSPAASVATQLKKKGVEIFGLNIGPDDAAFEQLKSVVSFPVTDHVFRVPILEDIIPLYYKLQGKGAYPSSCDVTKTVLYDECNRRCRCAQGHVTNCYRQRNDFLTMSLGERRRFLSALRNITTDTRFKQEYEAIVKPHKEFFKNMVHTPRYFLPWHRAFLLKMENLLRRIDCRISIPYWDWSITSGNPWSTGKDYLWSAKDYGIGGNGHAPDSCVIDGPFGKRSWSFEDDDEGIKCLKRSFIGTLPNAGKVRAALNIPAKTFSDFELTLRGFHHVVTCAVGGTACSLDNARSPEYLLITSYIDKIWGQWQAKGKVNWPVGFSVVSDLLPGFRTYTGEVVRLSKQPGAVSIEYAEPAARDVAKELQFIVTGNSSHTLLDMARDETTVCKRARDLYELTEVEQEHLWKLILDDETDHPKAIDDVEVLRR